MSVLRTLADRMSALRRRCEIFPFWIASHAYDNYFRNDDGR